MDHANAGNALDSIRRFSKTLCKLSKVGFVLSIVAAALKGLAMLWVWRGWPASFRLGNTNLYMPFAQLPDPEPAAGERVRLLLPQLSWQGFAAALVLIAVFVLLKRLFAVLAESGSPFRADVVDRLRGTAVCLLVLGFVSGMAAFAAAAIVWLLALIFRYGTLLQEESDTTL